MFVRVETAQASGLSREAACDGQETAGGRDDPTSGPREQTTEYEGRTALLSTDTLSGTHSLPFSIPQTSDNLVTLSLLFVADILQVAVRCSCVVDPYSVLCILG